MAFTSASDNKAPWTVPPILTTFSPSTNSSESTTSEDITVDNAAEDSDTIMEDCMSSIDDEEVADCTNCNDNDNVAESINSNDNDNVAESINSNDNNNIAESIDENVDDIAAESMDYDDDVDNAASFFDQPPRLMEAAEVRTVLSVVFGVPSIPGDINANAILTSFFNRDFQLVQFQAECIENDYTLDSGDNPTADFYVKGETKDFLEGCGIIDPRVRDIARILKGIAVDIFTTTTLEECHGSGWASWSEEKKIKKLVKWHARGTR